MTITQQIITIGVAVMAIVFTRFLPFFLFRPNRQTPPYILYLGKLLPPAIFAMLVVYCLRNISFGAGSNGFAQLLSVLVTIILHVRHRNMMLSTAGGTLCYMLLIRIC